MPIPRAVARFNRYVTNPIVRLIAGRVPGFCILTHVGRRSGRRYRTPLNVFRVNGTFVFALTYGSDADWVRNVMSASHCSIRYRGRDIDLSDLRFLDSAAGMALVPSPVGFVLRQIDVTEFLAANTAQPTR